MESISQLRALCQSTRPSIYKDFLSRIYYQLSIYFTWLCLLLKMSANQVTVLSGGVAILGGILISSDSKWVVLVGALLFHLFAILDMSDGEVARYRKQSGVAGHYLDWFMHFISSTSFVIGLFIASIAYLESRWLMFIGLVAVVIPILDKTVQNAGWTVICWTRLRDIKNNRHNADLVCESKSHSNVNFKKSILYRRLRFIVLSPLQDHWVPLILLLVAFLDLLLWFCNISLFDYRVIWLLYIGVVGPIALYFNVRHMVQSDALKKGYKKLVSPNEEIKFPEDDFLN